MAFTCVLWQGINGAGLGASRNGVYRQAKRGVTPLIRELKIRVTKHDFLENLNNVAIEKLR